jgi:hypothetical protein
MQHFAYCLLVIGYMLGSLFDHKDAGSIFLRNVDENLQGYTVLPP